ncbi:hypothetical protein [Bradyrhizobium jicamae]|uniref:hypothetical protein n=1 Tax=Bradyrhizobium jicamae TaxID=280332 RepID=UPI002010D782|nr:hypothetical protein [Bradyrhizobium jicamae]
MNQPKASPLSLRRGQSVADQSSCRRLINLPADIRHKALYCFKQQQVTALAHPGRSSPLALSGSNGRPHEFSDLVCVRQGGCPVLAYRHSDQFVLRAVVLQPMLVSCEIVLKAAVSRSKAESPRAARVAAPDMRSRRFTTTISSIGCLEGKKRQTS